MSFVPGPQAGAAAVLVWSLEMLYPEDVRPVGLPRSLPSAPLLLTAKRPAPELSQFFYRLVGTPWSWVDRLDWTARDWRAWVTRPGHRLVTCWVDGVPAGYFELDAVSGDIQIAYFGLAETFIGEGLGGWLLTQALRTAWDMPGARRVWVHTCSLDGPAALNNYEARGMRRYDETVEWRMSRRHGAAQSPEPSHPAGGGLS